MLQLKGITLDAEDKQDILKGIDLNIDTGKLIVITGPNGGGKSTLAKVITGIVKPTSGSILFDGQDISNLNITERARLGISFAFQQPVRFKGITVRDIINLAAGKELTDTQLSAYLYSVGLCANQYVDREINASLSGGEIKRIEIAMTLARNSKLCIFDEPEAGIDIWSFNGLIQVFENLRKNKDITILIVSHQERIFDIADEIIVLDDGRVTAHGSKADILPSLMGCPADCKYCIKEA